MKRLAAVLVVLACAPAHATECASVIPVGAATAALDGEARAAYLTARLERAAKNASIWTGTWAGVFSALVVGGTALAITSPSDARPDYYFTVAKSAVGLASLGVPAPRAIDGARWLRTQDRSDVCSYVAHAERLLARAARSEEDGRSLLMHVGNLTLNFASLMVLGMALRRWDSAAIQGVGGSAIGEIFLLTRPRTATRALEAYRDGRLGETSDHTLPVAMTPFLLRDGGGLSIVGEL